MNDTDQNSLTSDAAVKAYYGLQGVHLYIFITLCLCLYLYLCDFFVSAAALVKCFLNDAAVMANYGERMHTLV